MAQKPPAIVYVDGFNLYKGQLESRPQNKWLDLVALFDDVLDSFDVRHVHYFTARIKGADEPAGSSSSRPTARWSTRPAYARSADCA